MAGTRINQILSVNPDLQQKNILTSIEQTDKVMIKKQMGYTIRPHYEFLCELAHPNTIGYQRFFVSERKRTDGWLERTLSVNAGSDVAVGVAEQCLWALSFSSSTMNGVFGVFQELLRGLIERVGPLSPP